MLLTRRQLLASGAGGTLLLALPGCFARPPAPMTGFSFLTAVDVACVRVIARAILGAAADSQPARDAAVAGFDVAISGLPPAVRAEVRQLLDLLTSGLTRGVTTGIWSPWETASNDDVSSFLQRWRRGNVALFRSGYSALHALVNGGWYGAPHAWSAIGYPGPPVLQ